jgi:hypothetical protein
LASENFGVRRETGEEQSVRIRYDEGVAIHIDPEPCAGVREDAGEASAGGRIDIVTFAAASALVV